MAFYIIIFFTRSILIALANLAQMIFLLLTSLYFIFSFIGYKKGDKKLGLLTIMIGMILILVMFIIYSSVHIGH